MSNIFSSVPAKIITALGVVTTILAIVGGMVLFDDRYARAAEVKQTQAQLVQSMKLININLEVLTLENNVLKLERDQRSVQMELAKDPNNVILNSMLKEITQKIDKLNHRIGELENKRIVE